MRLLNKNTQTISYKTYQGLTQVTRDGLKTGEYTKTYSSLISEPMNVSPASGTTSLEMFGTVNNFGKVAVTCNTNCTMAEDSIVWVDSPTTSTNDYIVVGVSKSLNNIAYALRKVEVNGN